MAGVERFVDAAIERPCAAHEHRQPDRRKRRDCGDEAPLQALRRRLFDHGRLNGRARGALPPSLEFDAGAQPDRPRPPRHHERASAASARREPA